MYLNVLGKVHWHARGRRTFPILAHVIRDALVLSPSNSASSPHILSAAATAGSVHYTLHVK